MFIRVASNRSFAGGSTVLAHSEAGLFKPRIGKVFGIDEIVEAHREMEENTAGGRIVIVT